MYYDLFKDREEAGALLAEKLLEYENTNSIILAIPRGGVPVGYVISQKLNLPMDIILSKKIPHPYNKELAIGAVTMDAEIVDYYPNISKNYINSEISRIREFLKKKLNLYVGNDKPLDVKGKNVILVDDGIATGNTVLVSIKSLRKLKPAKIIVAVPVLPYEDLKTFQQEADEFVYLEASNYFRGVGAFYEHFEQVDDDVVVEMLSATSPI
ncbi:COG1926 Predicted phosphoribosyltransferases [Flavobacteriaceae bacterium]